VENYKYKTYKKERYFKKKCSKNYAVQTLQNIIHIAVSAT